MQHLQQTKIYLCKSTELKALLCLGRMFKLQKTS